MSHSSPHAHRSHWLECRIFVLTLLLSCWRSARAWSDEGIGRTPLAVHLGQGALPMDSSSSRSTRPLMREEPGLWRQMQMLPNGMIWLSSDSKIVQPKGPDDNGVGKAVGAVAGATKNATTNTGNITASQAVGVKTNTGRDTSAFLGALTLNATALLIFVLIFSCLRERVPQVYMNNARAEAVGGLNTAPFEVQSGILGWMRASLRCTNPEAEEACGLDIALLIEFLNFALKTLVVLALPLVIVLCPLHGFLGGENNSDFLAMTSMGNVEEGSGLYWVHALAVWYVIVAVQIMAFKAQQDFLPRRFKWLKSLPRPMSSTVLVEGIPSQYCSDTALRKYFIEMFPAETIENAYVAKHTKELKRLLNRQHAAQLALERAQHSNESEEVLQPLVQAVQEIQSEVEQKRAEILEESETIDRLLVRQLEGRKQGSKMQPLNANEQSMLRNSIYSSSGFVTFKDEREAMVLLHMQCSEDALEFVMSAAPDPADVIYSDLLRGPEKQAALNLMGNACMVGICVVSMPVVTALAYFTQIDVLKEQFEFIKNATQDNPRLDHILRGMLASWAMTVWNSLMPTILMLILYSFFPLRAHAWAQVKLQTFYFWIQAVFTILVTAVGSSPASQLEQLIERPFSIFTLLAESLPNSTNFYYNWITMQWWLVGMDVLRYFVLIKFAILSRSYAHDVAIELSEPEDTDFYGIGGRAARFTIMLAVALVFSTLSPLILVVCVVDSCIRRLIYGYLLVFAETRKPDLGGASWVLCLNQVQQSLVIYWILMVGVIAHHANSAGPVLLALPSSLFGLYMYWRFQTALRWTSLPFHWVCSDKYLESSDTRKVREASRDSYMQDELRPPNAIPRRARIGGMRDAALAVHRLLRVQLRRSAPSIESADGDRPLLATPGASSSADVDRQSGLGDQRASVASDEPA